MFYWLFQHHIYDKQRDAVPRGLFSANTTTCVQEIGVIAVVGLDGRSTRSINQVSLATDYAAVFEKLAALGSTVRHVIVMAGIPIIYPQMDLARRLLQLPDPHEEYFDRKRAKFIR